ncbi:MAG: DUF4132 domain-containing protein [Rhizobiales bacterium]|nr:DUF4132 domain-containing protein [Hyphomicrobiales bacterium]
MDKGRWHVSKTKPAAIAKNADLQERYNNAKKEIAELKKIMIAQRDRIDRLFVEDLSWKLHEVETHYIHHGLVGAIGGKLIWLIGTENGQTSAVYVAGHWQDVQGNPIVTDPESPTQLWHPVAQPVDAIFAWRSRLAALNIIQPTKQAHREIYLLTDAERASKVYSNRMAAHIVKQHQVATLMAGRGWRYSLMGAYDDGIDSQFASKTFSTSDLRAEYFIRALFSEEEQWNEAGIYLYVGTDQLRFVDDNDELVPLETVPIRLFSEVMREADLFVGVASVGNDPVWFDQGPTPEANTYWHGFSFGELDKLAQTRREVLQELLPRLKIKDVAHIEGKFLIVDGKLNTYKIHLGSSNILMVPGDRYLCIVPGSRTKTAASANIALPFEGDTRLSVILSKALMLAEDDKIKDEGILSQLKAE